jgi:hypothetical protein
MGEHESPPDNPARALDTVDLADTNQLEFRGGLVRVGLVNRSGSMQVEQVDEPRGYREL